jgi:hypothetical protein
VADVTDFVAQGRRNRRAGHQFERDVAAWFRRVGYPDAYTTRSQLGHDGFRAPGDVVGPVGLVVETKNATTLRWRKWLEQAEAEAGGRGFVVILKVQGSRDVGASIVRWKNCGPGILGEGVGTLRGFLALYDDTFNEEVA